MITINLLPEELRRKETPKVLLPEIPIKKTLIAIGLALVVVQFLLSLLAAVFGLRAGGIRREIRRLSEETRQIQDLKTKTSAAQDKLKIIRSMTQEEFYWASVLNSISESLTKGVWLRSLSLEDVPEDPSKVVKTPPLKTASKKPSSVPMTRVLKVDGSVMAPGQETAFIGRYVKSLKEEPYFTGLFMDIRLDGILQRKIKDFDVYDFTLLCKFRKGKI